MDSHVPHDGLNSNRPDSGLQRLDRYACSLRFSLVYLSCGAAVCTVAGILLGIPWVLPVLGALVAYPLYAVNLALGRPARAISLMMGWAVLLSVAVILASVAVPSRTEGVIWKGTEYTAEMIGWIRTGQGPEGSPSLFLPQHALHFAVFNIACLVSGGFAGLVMGAALLNYMNFYVGALIGEASNPLLAACLAWPPWAVLRVIGFIFASVPLSNLLIRRFRWSKGVPITPYWKYYLWGAGLVIADVVLKAVLAPYWRGFLAEAL